MTFCETGIFQRRNFSSKSVSVSERHHKSTIEFYSLVFRLCLIDISFQIQHIKHMEECQRLSMEIYSIVELVEYWDSFWSKEHRQFPAHGPYGGPDDGRGHVSGLPPGHGPGLPPGHGPGLRPGHEPGFRPGYRAEATPALPPRRSRTIYPLNEDGGGFDSDAN